MYESSEARSRYLALALASRKALRSLNGYVETGQTDEQLRSTVKEVVDSLKAAREETNLFGPVPDESAFTSYEQLMTLWQVMEEADHGIVEDLTGLFSSQESEAVRKQRAGRAIKFFYTLENRALHQYGRQIGSREP